VFLGTVFQGERIGLRPQDDRYFFVYFAQFFIALLDSRELRTLPLPQGEVFDINDAGEGVCLPSPAPHPLGPSEGPTVNENVLGMSPV
jgi:hypothetical protein